MTSPELKDFLQEKKSTRTGAEIPQVYLAAFGKHPGWNDHIDDLGFETQTLVVAKRFLYFEGISSQIDQGTWERLDPASRHAVFDHSFLWQRGDEVLFGLMRDSTDGKGRSRYPMVLCLHATGVSVAHVLNEFAPRVEQAMAACAAVATAEEVEGLLARARTELRGSFPPLPAAAGEVIAGPALPGHPGLGPDNEGLYRILYQLRSQFGDWAPGRVDFSDSAPLPRAAHLRAPQLFPSLEAGAPVWLDFFRSQLDREAPVLLLWSRSAPWVDIIVGPPGGADLFVLKANALAVPPATEVPYQMDQTFRQEAEALFPEFAAGAASVRTVFGIRAAGRAKRKISLRALAQRLAKFWSGAFRSAQAWLKGQPKKLLFLVGGVALGLTGGVAALIFWATRPAGGEAPAPSPTSVARAAEIPPETLGAWQALCTANYEWLGRLQGDLKSEPRRTKWRSDAALRVQVLERLDAANAKLAGLSPQQLASTSGAGISLANNPPPSLVKPEVAGKILEASEVAAELARALRDWPLLIRLTEMEKEFTGLGWTAPAKELGTLRATVQLDASLAGSVDAIVERRDELLNLSDLATKSVAGFALLERDPDPFLRAWAESAEAEAKAADDLRKFAGVLAERTRHLEEALALVANGAGLQREPMLKEGAMSFDPSADGGAQILAWLNRARGYVSLPDSEKPLAPAIWTKHFATLRAQAGQLRQLAPPDFVAEFSNRIDSLSSRLEAWRLQPRLRRDEPALKADAAGFESERNKIADELVAEIGRRANPKAWIAAVRLIEIDGSEAVTQQWVEQRDQLLRDFEPMSVGSDVGRFLELQRRVGQLEQFLRAAAGSPEFAAAPAESGWSAALARDWEREATKFREFFLRALLEPESWKEPVAAPSWPEFVQRPAAVDVLKDYAQTIRAELQLGDKLNLLARKIEEGGVIESLPSGEFTFGNRGDGLAKSAFASKLSQRVKILRELAAETDRVRLIEAAAQQDFAVAITAWRALGRVTDWPATAAEYALDDARRTELLRVTEQQLAENPRRDALRTELAAEGGRRWRLFLQRAKTAEDFAAAFSRMQPLGVSATSLTGVERYNEWLYRVKTTGWRDLKTEELSVRRADFLRELDGFSTGKEMFATQIWIGEFNLMSMTEIPVVLARVGPGAKGWKLVESTDSDLLSFTWSRGGQPAHRLDFRLLKPVTGKPVYLCTTEFSVQLMVDWSEETALWPELMSSLNTVLQDELIDKQPRRGPRSYLINEKLKKLTVSTAWSTANAADYYPADQVPPPPDGQSPLNYVSAKAGQLLAQSLHCRLPSPEEWRFAAIMEQAALAPSGGALANRRDQAWLRQLEYVIRMPEGRAKRWPVEEIFNPAGTITLGGLEKPAVEYDDGVLWFSPVGNGSGRDFKNLVGNVAEFVADEKAGTFFVIGASSLSSAAVLPGNAYPLGKLNEPYFSDVGFRLAFSIDKLSAGQRIAQLVSEAKYQ